MSALPYSVAQQAQAIKAAITKYSVPAQVFMGMYNEETSLGMNISTSSASAVGPFQFTSADKGVGVIYPMTNTPTLTDFQQQAYAAAALLASNYKQEGSWQNALAAYNAGPGNIGAGEGYASAALAFQIPADWAAALGAALGSPIAGGGVYGLGGSGTPANTASLWTVGDTSNPDQDYWTTINQYAMDAQWYAFSDGETLFVADGIQLMAQQPRAVIRRTDPAVIQARCTYDNTSWTYTHTHKHRGHIQRRTSLARVTSPTEVTLQIICDIDEFRAGDTVRLVLFGPADGAWLIGDTVRDAFLPYTELTLVQAMQPINAATGTLTASAPPGTPGNGVAPGPGGYVNQFAKATGLVPNRIDDGVDYSMDVGSEILAIGNVQIVNIRPWGGGAGNQPIMTMRFIDGPKANQYYYIAEQITPTVNQGQVVAAGSTICKYAPSGTAIETGWAASSGDGTTLAQANGHGGQVPSPEGSDFSAFLVSLGAPGGT